MMSLKKIIFLENQSLDLNYVIHILSCFLLIMVYLACCLLSINPHPTKWGPMKPQVIINIYHRSHGWTTCSRFKQFVLMYHLLFFMFNQNHIFRMKNKRKHIHNSPYKNRLVCHSKDVSLEEPSCKERK